MPEDQHKPGEPELPPETAPRPLMTDYDDVKEYVDKVDHDVPDERREVRAGELAPDHPTPPQGDAPPDPGA